MMRSEGMRQYIERSEREKREGERAMKERCNGGEEVRVDRLTRKRE